MTYQKLPFHPGIYKDDSPLEAKGYWVDSDKIRFVRGLPETIYGWEYASTATLLGMCRGAISWADNGRNAWAAFGTHLRLYAMDGDGNVTDITPIISRQSLSLTFTTIKSSNIVSINLTNHGLVSNQKFQLLNCSPPAIDGITTAGTYTVAGVTDANDFTFVANQAAASGVSGAAAACDFYVFLAPGNQDGIGGLGFGVGQYGTGAYGNPAAGVTYWPRTWSLDHWGENLIANPRGGGIYEWAPNVSASELTTNGTFSGSAAGWTFGSGWAYGSNTVSATSCNSALSQVVTVPVAAWCTLIVNVSAYASGSIQASVNGGNVGVPISAAGKTFLTFFSGAGGAQTIALTGSTANLSLSLVSVQVETTGQLLPNSPAQATSLFVTPERILVACGCTNAAGTFDPMNLSWTDADNNQTWTAAATNLAGSELLSNGSRIVRGLAGAAEDIILTDTCIYSMQYVPDPAVVYSFIPKGTMCGLIGPNAVAQVAGVTYWMDPAGGFWSYDGSTPQPLLCTLARHVWDNLAPAQQDKIYAFPLTVNGRIEVWWSYPDARDGVECSRYLIYHVAESLQQGFPVWGCGTFNRTAWVPAGIYPYPLAVDAAGGIWFHEKGFAQNGTPRSWSISSAYFDLGDGAQQMRIMGLQPDADDLQGGYTVQLNANIRNGSGVLSRSFGPYSINAASGKVSVRANGEEAQLTFSGNPNLPAAVIALCGLPPGYTVVHSVSTATVSTGPANVTIPTSTSTVTVTPSP